jgi:hypothetical protein
MIPNGVAAVKTTVAAVLLVATLALSAQSQKRLPNQRILVRVTKVHVSPGIWSGIIAATQQVDGSVMETSSKQFRAGQELFGHVFLLKGYAVLDSDVPKLSDAIRPGTNLSIRIGPRCTSRVVRLPDLNVDPSCVTVAH